MLWVGENKSWWKQDRIVQIHAESASILHYDSHMSMLTGSSWKIFLTLLIHLGEILYWNIFISPELSGREGLKENYWKKKLISFQNNMTIQFEQTKKIKKKDKQIKQKNWGRTTPPQKKQQQTVLIFRNYSTKT